VQGSAQAGDAGSDDYSFVEGSLLRVHLTGCVGSQPTPARRRKTHQLRK
jgi:hypothetical protein